jgi:hypothetical protein
MLRPPTSIAIQYLVDLAGGSPAPAALAARLASLIDVSLVVITDMTHVYIFSNFAKSILNRFLPCLP